MKSPLKTSLKITSTDTGEYRYFFNGQEADNEVFAEMSNFGYEFRQYDSRLGRWWSVDPKWNEYPGVSPYVFCNGSPIDKVDTKGLSDDWIYNLKTNKYSWDGNVTGPENTPEGYEYVGQTKQDVANHFKQHNPVTSIFRSPQFEENRTPYNGEINIPKSSSQVEIWLSSPSANVGEGICKTTANFLYSFLNSPYSLFTGKSIAGSQLESSQKTDAFMDFAPFIFPITMYTTNVVVRTGNGLKGYNSFVKKSKGITSSEGLTKGMKWQTHAGQLFEINKINQKALNNYKSAETGSDIINEVMDEINKNNNE